MDALRSGRELADHFGFVNINSVIQHLETWRSSVAISQLAAVSSAFARRYRLYRCMSRDLGDVSASLKVGEKWPSLTGARPFL